MPIDKPTPEQLYDWDTKLKAERLGQISLLKAYRLREEEGVEVPAKAVRGGLLWRERGAMAQRVARRRPPVSHVCPECRETFLATRRAKFCGRQCQMRSLMRARRVSGKLQVRIEGRGFRGDRSLRESSRH